MSDEKKITIKKIEGVMGDFDFSSDKIHCVGNKKYGRVELCFNAGMYVPFASIKLHSRDLAVDADAVFDDAVKLGEEIAARFNARPIEDDLREQLDALRKAICVYAREELYNMSFENDDEVVAYFLEFAKEEGSESK